MATNFWMGNAEAIAQVDTLTPANVEVGDVFTVTFLDDFGATLGSVSYTAAAATEADVCTGLVAAINGSGNAAVRRVVATDDTTHVTLTAADAGRPFNVSTDTTNVGGGADTQTLTATPVTANSGPNDVKCAANWSTRAVPAVGEDVVITPDGGAMLYNLDLSGTNYGRLVRMPGCYGQIGRIEDGRLYYLAGTFTSCELAGAGTLVAVNVLAAAISPLIQCSGSPPSSQSHVVYLKGSALVNIDARQGVVGVAEWPGDTATVTGTFMASGGAVLTLGEGVTVTGTTAKAIDATIQSRVSVPTVNVRGSTYRQWSGYWTTLTAREGSTVEPHTASASYGATTLYDSTLNSDVTLGAKTLASLTLHGDSRHMNTMLTATLSALSDYSNQPTGSSYGGAST